MNAKIRLFNFFGIPVNFSLWFGLLFLIFDLRIVLLIFLSILVHELSHAFVARWLGYYVHEVCIEVLGGFALMDSYIPERDSWKISISGPLSNLFLCLLFFLLGRFFSYDILNIGVVINFILFIFNMLPIHKMDGGLILRDILLMKLSSRDKANRISNWVSLVFSLGLLVFSLVNFDMMLIVFSCFYTFYSFSKIHDFDNLFQ